MEPLRIRIPKVYSCETPTCHELVRWGGLCVQCILDTRVRQEVTPTALPSQSEVVHRSALRRYLCG